MRFAVLGLSLLTVVVASSGCAWKGSGKGTTPTWKVYQVEQARPLPETPIRTGSIELRVNKAFLEENRTLFSTSHWVLRAYVSVTSSKKLLLEEISSDFSFLATSGQTYTAYVSARGPGRATWQHQSHTGEPTYLPPNVTGELELMVQVGDSQTHDDLAGLSFRGITLRREARLSESTNRATAQSAP